MAINTNILKTYAPEARRTFIAAVQARAARFGITEKGSSEIREEGNIAIINGLPYPRSFAQQRRDLDHKIALRGYSAVMDEVAYTWFNRFAAIRYMELHDYLDHGVRVLSHPNGGATPEILEKAANVELPGLKRDNVVALKLDGTKDEELYRLLLVAQCNALHAAMPFLFEKINDETELLLPDNLLHSDSVIRQMVDRIPDSDWQHIEIIGWLYQFYISEKKDEVIGKVVKSEDIPAATQLFTPNWIVKYMVQNSLGAKWLATYPDSPLREKMEYYIPPARQPPEVQAQIDADTPKSIDPESITFLDPASGSGHILVEAYDVFKEFYLERGYRAREIPRLILEKNVYGLDIDDRAAQLSGFALMMRARADDRQILSVDKPVKLNVFSIQESNGLDADEIAKALLPAATRFNLLPAGDLLPDTVAQPPLALVEAPMAERKAVVDLIRLFADAKTFGSLISVPPSLMEALPTLRATLGNHDGADLVSLADFGHAAAAIAPLVQLAMALGRQYDVVAANPPYMGSNGMNARLKKFVQIEYPDSKWDLMTCFMDRVSTLTKSAGRWGMINLPSWMFLSSFVTLRDALLQTQTVSSLIHLGRGIFGSDFGSVAFVVQNSPPAMGSRGAYRRLFEKHVQVRSNEVIRKLFLDRSYGTYSFEQRAFSEIPGSAIAYWVTDRMVDIFKTSRRLAEVADVRQGLATGKDDHFLRFWHEVDFRKSRLSGDRNAKWVPFSKGGEFRKWFGNNMLLVNWDRNGAELKASSASRVQNEGFYFREFLTWSLISSGAPSFRSTPEGTIFGHKGPGVFARSDYPIDVLLALLNSRVCEHVLGITSSTIGFEIGHLRSIPVKAVDAARESGISRSAVAAAKADWDAYENSWDFLRPAILRDDFHEETFAASYSKVAEYWRAAAEEMRKLEERNNEQLLLAYGLDQELPAGVSLKEVTMTCNASYRYPDDHSQTSREVRLRNDTAREFISYAIGCMMGRYSLAVTGLVYAGTAGEDFDAGKYGTFAADPDGIVPITEEDWFADDAANRIPEFLRVAWSRESEAENLQLIAEAVEQKAGESSIGAIRRYLSREFFKDHVRAYRKRPIYWLFSSGKEKAFEALVYLHRYNESTLARMRLEYVVPLQTQMANRIERLTNDLKTGSLSSAETKKRNVQLEKLQKQQDELRRFEEELHHFADQRIKIDLDDGVKVNYGKFGNLLADVKAITGGSDD